jgi:hypothetical protein
MIQEADRKRRVASRIACYTGLQMLRIARFLGLCLTLLLALRFFPLMLRVLERIPALIALLGWYAAPLFLAGVAWIAFKRLRRTPQP